jgi:hypothetical protein
MRRALIGVVFAGACYTSKVPPPESTPQVVVAAKVARVERADPNEAVCCCTFGFAEDVDFPDIRKWESHAPTCETGGGLRPPGQCIAWSWCGYAPGTEPRSLAQRPNLRPLPPLTSDECCCAQSATGAEEFRVMGAAACAATAMAQCIDAGFCDRTQ